jgi:hypothetical protein
MSSENPRGSVPFWPALVLLLWPSCLSQTHTTQECFLRLADPLQLKFRREFMTIHGLLVSALGVHVEKTQP